MTSDGKEEINEPEEEIEDAAASFLRRKNRLRPIQPKEEVDDVFLKRIDKYLRTADPIEHEKKAKIYRVPPELRDSAGKFYKPKVVSIGPYHKGRKEEPLRLMQDHKWICLKKLLKLGSKDYPDPEESQKLLRKCFEKMLLKELLIREYYSETLDRELEDGVNLATRMLLDGGFILYLLLWEAKKVKPKATDVRLVIGRVWIWNLVRYDLLLLENQIPFFVIRELCDILVPGGSDFNLVRYALQYFSRLDPCRKSPDPRRNQSPFYIPEGDVHHLLHLVYKSVLPCPHHYRFCPNRPSEQWIPSATELKELGVKFKKRNNENKRSMWSFLDIKFNDGVMEIPQLRLHDYSISLLRNLVAFEQCYPDTECYITAYAALMHCLIDKEEDVRSLHLDQILVSKITTEEDAGTHFFRRLRNGTQFSPKKNYLGGLINEVNKYSEKWWPRTRAYIVRTYFINPLTVILMIGGLIAFVLSITSNSLSIKRNV